MKNKKERKIKIWWRGFRLAFDPGYPLLTEFLPEVWKPSVTEKLTFKELTPNRKRI